MTTLVDDLVPDELWTLVEPLLPVPPRPPYGGRHRTIPDRHCFAAIVYMARTSTPWRLMPSTSRSSTSWGRRVGWTGRGRAWTRPACAPNVGGPRGRKSRRSWQAWKQAPPGVRRWRAAADRRDHCRQRQRHHHVRSGPRRCPAGSHAIWAAAHSTWHGPRRQGLRQRGQPCVPAPASDQAAARPPWGGVLDQTWAAPLEGRAVAVLVELLAAATGTLGPGLWAVVRVPAGSLRGDLLQPARRKVQDERLTARQPLPYEEGRSPCRSVWQASRSGRSRRLMAAMVAAPPCPYHPASPGPGSAEHAAPQGPLLDADRLAGGVEGGHPVQLGAGRQGWRHEGDPGDGLVAAEGRHLHRGPPSQLDPHGGGGLVGQPEQQQTRAG